MGKSFTKYFDNEPEAERFLLSRGYAVNSKKTTPQQFVYEKNQEESTKIATVDKTAKGIRLTIKTVEND